MSPVPFLQLQAFLAVARHQSFSNAARELAVTRSALSQAVRQLEQQLNVTLLTRTTRSVSLTDAGRRLVDGAVPSLGQLANVIREVSVQPGEAVGRLRLTVPRSAAPFVIEPVLPTFRVRHPRIEVEVTLEDRLVDIVAEGFDAGVRLSESIERDMVQVRLTDPFRFVAVAAPSYLKRRGAPERPEDLLRHECITFRSQSTAALYAWEFERGRRTWRVPVNGSVVTGDMRVTVRLAERGLGIAYVLEPTILEPLERGRLKIVLEEYAPTVPGFFAYFPTLARRSGPLRLFLEAAKELGVRKLA
ncbi:MAG: LysR family transcriptional regulator [Polyangiaceae bacterium]